jgi:hypothetical protein
MCFVQVFFPIMTFAMLLYSFRAEHGIIRVIEVLLLSLITFTFEMVTARNVTLHFWATNLH